jgi:hypothetical protein
MEVRARAINGGSSLPDPDTTSEETTDLDSDEWAAEAPKSLFHRLRTCLSFVTIEPMLFLQMVAMSSTAINVQSFYIERLCRETYANDSSITCDNLTAFKAQGQCSSVFPIMNNFIQRFCSFS